MEKKSLLIFNVILLVAVLVLFALVLGNKECSKSHTSATTNDSTQYSQLPIAYINIDSLLTNYTFAKISNEALIKKQEDSRATVNAKARQLQKEMNDFNRKLENNAFLSRERAEKAQQSLVSKQKNLQETENRLAQQLMEEQQKMSEQLRDTINTYLKIFNKDNRYEMIISNTANDNILQAKSSYDITSEVIEALNKRYQKSK